jgi:hypothetical protein
MDLAALLLLLLLRRLVMAASRSFHVVDTKWQLEWYRVCVKDQ